MEGTKDPNPPGVRVGSGVSEVVIGTLLSDQTLILLSFAQQCTSNIYSQFTVIECVTFATKIWL